jgi:ubiquinone/menaquinone biosynthesis C-methylase UbiE
MTIEGRKEVERAFHNLREEWRQTDPQEHDLQYSNRRFYRTATESKEFISHWLAAHGPGTRALDYCCGTGQNALELARLGAEVTGVDISDRSLATARAEARRLGLADRATFLEMDAEQLTFDDASFDLIVCNGVLHHVQLARAFEELARVLRPGGRILCVEALSHNPLIHLYRRRTPHLRTPWEVEHILKVQDIRRARGFFGRVEIRFFHLASLAAIPFIDRPGFGTLLRALNGVDRLILRVPGLQKMAWQAIFVLSEPRPVARSLP